MKPSILFVSTSSNWPLTDGKRQRTWFLIEALSEKFRVDLLLIGYQSEKNQIEKSTNAINKLFFFDIADANLPNLGYPSFLLSKKQKSNNSFLINQIENLFSELNGKNQYSFVFSRYIWPLLILSLPKEVKVVCDIDDVYFEAQKSRIQNETNFLRKLKLQVLFVFGTKKVKKLVGRIDIPIIVKESDRTFYGLKKAVCVPNIPFGFYIDKESTIHNAIINPAETMKFGFIGKLSFRPNYLGLIEFINSVWNPLIKGGEHQNFFIRAKLNGLKVATTRLCGVVHDRWSPAPELFKELRERGATYQKIALDEFGIEKVENFAAVMKEKFGE